MIPGVGALNGQVSGTNLTEGLKSFAGNTTAAAGGMETSFVNMLSQAATRTIGTMENAENLSVQALQGDAQVRDVADAVMSAEQSLQAAVAIRDKIVTAYLEVSRMAI